MKSVQVIRTHLSPYQSETFVISEKMAVESIPGVSYGNPGQMRDTDVILVTNTHTVLSELPNELLKKTKLIIHPNSGYDHFEKDQKIWNDIPVVIGHAIRAGGVAEYTLGCLFKSVLSLPQHLAWDKKRLWPRKLITGMNIWVHGYGHIGSTVAQTLKTIGANVTVIDPYKRSSGLPHLSHWKDGSRKEAQAHLICMSLNKTSKHMFDENFFSDLHPSAIVINGARGKLIDEKFLREFLLCHPESQAFLDVFENEPFGTEWHHFPQVWKTSHIAGVTTDLDQRILDFEVDVLKNYMSMSDEKFSEHYRYELLQNKIINGVLI